MADVSCVWVYNYVIPVVAVPMGYIRCMIKCTSCKYLRGRAMVPFLISLSYYIIIRSPILLHSWFKFYKHVGCLSLPQPWQ